MKIDAGSKVKTPRTWLCFQRLERFVFSGLRVTMRITRKCPAVRFALYIAVYKTTCVESGPSQCSHFRNSKIVKYKQYMRPVPDGGDKLTKLPNLHFNYLNKTDKRVK